VRESLRGGHWRDLQNRLEETPEKLELVEKLTPNPTKIGARFPTHEWQRWEFILILAIFILVASITIGGLVIPRWKRISETISNNKTFSKIIEILKGKRAKYRPILSNHELTTLIDLDEPPQVHDSYFEVYDTEEDPMFDELLDKVHKDTSNLMQTHRAGYYDLSKQGPADSAL